MNGKVPERLRSLDVCSGAGGLALGLEQSGFDPVMLLDNRDVACETLRLNRPQWHVLQTDLMAFDPSDHPRTYDVDLLSAGLPRVRATASVQRKDNENEVRLLQATTWLLHGVRPRAVLIENVPHLARRPDYQPLRDHIAEELDHLGYRHRWLVLDAADFGVPQVRMQGIMVAFRGDVMDAFTVPEPTVAEPRTVGEALAVSMASRGWPDAARWARQANEPARTLVGGSWNRGGADLGPRGTKQAWARMGVDGGTVADRVPDASFVWDPNLGRKGMVALTTDQAAALQGFPHSWAFAGRKTARYRQIGHASPPPVAHALGLAIAAALRS
ncbi:DNA cytosine methyltransferase [Streptomyces globosus]